MYRVAFSASVIVVAIAALIIRYYNKRHEASSSGAPPGPRPHAQRPKICDLCRHEFTGDQSSMSPIEKIELFCRHSFHRLCLTTLLETQGSSHKTCPVGECRRTIPRSDITHFKLDVVPEYVS